MVTFFRIAAFVSIAFLSFPGHSHGQNFNINVPIDNTHFRNDEKIDSAGDSGLVYFLERTNFSGAIHAGRPNGPEQNVVVWDSRSFERRIALTSRRLPNSSQLLFMQNEWLYFISQRGPKWIVNRISFKDKRQIEDVGSAASGWPQGLKVSNDGESVFVVVTDGIHKFSTTNAHNHIFIKENIGQLPHSYSSNIALSSDDKRLVVASAFGWVFLFENSQSSLKMFGLRDFTVGLPKKLSADASVADFNEFSRIRGHVQVTSIALSGNMIVVGNWGRDLLFLDANSRELNILASDINFGRARGIFDYGRYLFFAMERGDVYALVKEDIGRVAQERSNRFKKLPWSDMGIQLGEIFSISSSNGIEFSILGKTREVARIKCCDDFELIARDTPMPGGGRATIIKDGYFDLNTSTVQNFDSITYRYGSFSGKILEIYDVLHRPDIVRAKLRGEDIRSLIGDLTIEKALQNPAPKVEITNVTAVTSAKRVRVPYTITPQAGGIAEVRVFQNGKLVSSDGTYKDAPGKAYAPVAGKSAEAGRYAEANLLRNATANEIPDGKSNSLLDQLIVRGAPEKKCSPGKSGDPCQGEIEVDVIPGEENTITVVAFNRDNTIQSVPASISFKSTLPMDEPNLWVVGVGIDLFAGISSLTNAHKDAQDFICTYAGKEQVRKLSVACTDEGKAKTLFKPQNIHVVGALFDTKATKSNILAALAKVAKQAKPGDTFVWFVASHGMMDANSNFGIVAYDTQCLNSKCTDIKGHLTSNEILEASKNIKAMKQLVVLDTCHSGGLDSKLSGLYDARVSLLAKNMGLHLYASAQATEAAQDGNPGTNGTFTAQLLEGIKGAAPRNQEGQISVMTLGDYAKQKTVEATQPESGAKDAKPAQTPVIQHFGKDTGLVGLR